MHSGDPSSAPTETSLASGLDCVFRAVGVGVVVDRQSRGAYTGLGWSLEVITDGLLNLGCSHAGGSCGSAAHDGDRFQNFDLN